MAAPATIQSDYGCGCGVDVFGCLVHKMVLALCPADDLNPNLADVDAKGRLQALAHQRGHSLPRYEVRLA